MYNFSKKKKKKEKLSNNSTYLQLDFTVDSEDAIAPQKSECISREAKFPFR